MKKESKELEVKKEMGLELAEDLQGSWGSEESEVSDIIIPKLLLMHGQSEEVLQGRQQQGNLVRSTDWHTYAKRDQAVTVVPFLMKKVWRISEIKEGKAEWVREEPWTPVNTDLEWDYVEEGKQYRRDQAYNFFAIILDDFDKGKPFPTKLQFTRTSRRAGKIIADHFAKSKLEKVPPALLSFNVGSEFINGEKHKYFIFTARQADKTPIEVLRECKKWYDIIIQQKDRIKEHEPVVDAEVVVDESEAPF